MVVGDISNSSPDDYVEQYVEEVEVSSTMLELKEKISRNLEILYVSGGRKLVSELDILQKVSNILTVNHQTNLSQIQMNNPVCKFVELKNEKQLGMQLTQDVLALLHTFKELEHEYTALYYVIFYCCGAEIDAVATVTVPLIDSLVSLMIELDCSSKNLEKLIVELEKYMLTLGIKIPSL